MEKNPMMISIRHHVTPRVHLYHPLKISFPIPLKYIDVTRLTVTDLEERELQHINDIWLDKQSKEAIEYRINNTKWTGRTVFKILRKKLDPGYTWAGNKIIEEKPTTKPPQFDSES